MKFKTWKNAEEAKKIINHGISLFETNVTIESDRLINSTLVIMSIEQ